ncbi:hypothetical protein ACSNNV_15785, partial [Faecalibacterium prausnitzii]|uniref:hypothetical protein n=1 Tax=Faecalibacterium prausnitzii TaxID=853 RepID=UPI003F1CE332
TTFLAGNSVLLQEPVGKIFKAGGTVQYSRNLSPQSVLHGFKLKTAKQNVASFFREEEQTQQER